MQIPFNIPFYSGNECNYIKQAFDNQQLSGDGIFTKKVSQTLETLFNSKKALLTHSCTAALEMCALLLDIKPGDEIIMPSFTFVSTANAFVLRGGIPVFVDIDPLTQNLDDQLVINALSSRTKAIVVVHYAGVSSNMNKLKDISMDKNIPLVEDAAQSIYACFNNLPLGSIGDMATVSFHETKNISCGEGGCLLLNDEKYIERAEMIREKGTNRSLFSRGQVDKYTWVDIGSSYLPGEVSAAFLCAQLERGKEITDIRLMNCRNYNSAFGDLSNGDIRLMYIPEWSSPNGHIYYFMCKSLKQRTEYIDYMRSKLVACVFHYVPLHSSPAGKKYGRTSGSMHNTDRAADCLVRLPVYPGVNTKLVSDHTINFFSQRY
ncbi:dTDP-4-amino-4,6-dideoxygalactose transaminase [Prochlorococcus marinus]|uniref:dTDP-4-amino-4,6-dideoxygalactose transaminase n=1 Tax=Prochlorococcus marinus TaxID=1219 RepID=UPI0007B3261D|nr:dTDP-4-amino-4,6-dideoxygalactose transaminase [Prochlorococcus marinus]KZR73696.1 dTDP-4-amino-4,6-dideoxygalactose transaminase [Prochlorococcus marinus str. MIT 1320]